MHALFNLKYFLGILAFTAACYASTRLGYGLSVMQHALTPLWLTPGLALAVLLLKGPRLAPGIALGVLIAAYLAGEPAPAAMAISLGATGAALASAWMLGRTPAFSPSLDRPGQLLTLVGVGAFLAPALAATISLAGEWFVTSFDMEHLLALWTLWWARDALGVLLVAPLILVWAAPRRPESRSTRTLESIGLALLQVLVYVYVFLAQTGPGSYLCLPLSLLSAMYLGLRWVAVANFVTFLIAATGTMLASGPFAAETPIHGLMHLQTLGIIACLTTLLVGGLAEEWRRIRIKLNETAERLRSLVNLSSDWIWEQDENLRFVTVTGRAADEGRLRIEDIIGKTRWEIGTDGVSDEVRRIHDEAVAARQPFHDLVITRRSVGPEPQVICVSGEPVFDASGQFRGYRGVARDVTLERRAEREIEESRHFLDSLIDAIPSPVLVKDAQHRYIAANAAFCIFFQRELAQIIGKNDYDFFSPEDAAFFQQTDIRAFEEAGPIEYERPYTPGDSTRAMMVRKSGLTCPDGTRVVVLLLIDVTERKAAEERLRHSEQRFRSLTELSADWYWEQDAELRFRFISSSDKGRPATPIGEMLGKTRLELDSEWESEAAREAHRQSLLARAPFKDLLLRTRTNGRYVLVSGEPVFDTHGNFTGYRGVARDYTVQKEVEAALRTSEERFRALTHLSSDWYWEQDEQFRFTRIEGAPDNPDVPYFQRNAIGQTHWDIAPRGLTAAQWAQHKMQLEAHLPFRDLELGTLDTTRGPRDISVSGEPVFGADGRFLGYRGTSKDISERKLAERRIGQLLDMYAAMTEANDAIIHCKDTGALFSSICRIAIEYGHFVFARVAMIDMQTGWVPTVASAGDDKGLAERFVVSMDPSRSEGQGPSGHAMRAGTNYLSNDITTDNRNRPWRDVMAELGIRAQATFLLRRHGKVVGALHLYAGQVGFFDNELTSMLEKLSANLSFALENFQREEARLAAEAALRESEIRFRDFADAAGEYVWESDLEGRYTYVSSRVQSVWSYTDQELIGWTPAHFMPSGEPERVSEWLAQNMRPDGSFRDLEHRVVTRNGEMRWLLINAVGVFDERGNRIGQRGTGRDITDRKAAEARISYLATRDPLTELPNRVLFNDRLEQGIVAARRTNQSLALLFIDLDRFKNINDSLGHPVGDLLLREVATRMLACIRKGDTLSRLGGDEFVVTLEGLQHAEDAAQVAGKIIKALARPVEIAGHTLTTSCSIGISIFPMDAEDDRTLMKNADTAMYHAKERGRNNYQFFSPEMNVRAVERHNLETALRLAIERQEFVLFFQPQVDIRTSKVVGMEALLRWQHPDRGLLSPATFIGVAEESGLIDPIGQWVLRTACQRAKAWQDGGYRPLKIAVNISARQLNKPRDFSRGLSRVLSSTGLDPRYLELEMTESLLLHNAEENIAVLRKLGQDGVRIAVDDFGIGYSSLAYLRQLPIDSLKIDRSFVRDIETDPEDAAIIHAVVAMAHSLELQVTAEGVETRGQLEALERLGCDEYQGFLFSKPLPAVEVAARFLAPGELDLEIRD